MPYYTADNFQRISLVFQMVYHHEFLSRLIRVIKPLVAAPHARIEQANGAIVVESLVTDVGGLSYIAQRN